MVFKVAIVQCRGTPFEIGRAQGELHAQTSKGRAFLRRKKFWTPWWFNLDAHRRMYMRLLDIDFVAWVKGEDLPVTQLTGQLGGMALPIDWPPKRSKITAKRQKPAGAAANA